MKLHVETTRIDGVWRIAWERFTDNRGDVMPLFVKSGFPKAGLPALNLEQANLTTSYVGVIRGMHGEEMDKCLVVLAGKVYAVIVDARDDSPTKGEKLEVTLRPGEGLYVSAGMLNSFQCLEGVVIPPDHKPVSLYFYMFNNEWSPTMPGKSANPLLSGVEWPIPDRAIVSEKDASAGPLEEVLGE